MFLENVKHILKVDNGKVFSYIMHTLTDNNYNVQIINISPHEYGIPQQRERVFFICIRNDIYNGKDIKLIEDKTDKIILNNYLQNKNEIDKKYFIKDTILNVLNAWDEMIKEFEIGEKISPTILINEFYKEYTQEEFKKLASWRQNYIIKNKPLYQKYKNKWDIWYNKYKDLLNTREIYCKLEWQVGIIKKDDSIFNYIIQIRQSGIRVKKLKYFPTLVAISQVPIYGKEKRYITARECARIQSFSDNYILN